jgi:hypothetical protein
MRLIICLLLLLTACGSHDVRCDGRLQRINQPASHAQASSSPAPAATPGLGDQ